MIHTSSTPLWEQVAILTLGPPIGAGIWLAMSRGWAATVQGGTVSEKAKRRQRVEFWALLIIAYAMSVGMALYAWLR